MVKTLSKFLGVMIALFFGLAHSSKAQIPQYDHVVILIEENKTYSEIIGNTDPTTGAPYLNSIADSGALFTNSHAVEHPSQPNYLDLYSGFNQGVPGDNTSPLAPFTTGNLGASLIANGYTFADYSESLPYSLPSNRSVAVDPSTPGATAYGYTGDSYSDNPALNEYQRKHNPAVNWQTENATPGNAQHQLPAIANQPFTAFPTNFSQLPTVSIVVPNEQNDMHDGTIHQADLWAMNNIEAYRQWAVTHNSLLIVTWDENDDEDLTDPGGEGTNQIATIFSGAHVVPGQYNELITHFNVLRTIEDMYGLPTSGPGDAAASDITDVFAVPEPSSNLLCLAGGLLIVFALVRKRKPQRLRRRIVPGFGIVFMAALDLALSGATSQATTVIAPNELPDPSSSGTLPASQTYGDTSNLFPLFPGVGTALEYQQVYAASQFAAFVPGGENITSIVFRVGADAADRLDHGAFATTIPLIQFTLSTTAAAPDSPSSTFSANLGADATTVYGVAGVGSPLAVSSAGSLQGNPAPFDITVPLTTPFFYNPAQGNLLLQVQNYSGAASPTGVELDGTMVTGDSVSRIMNLGSATSATATGADSEGLVTEFVATPVPEANITALLTTGLLFALPWLRRPTSNSQSNLERGAR